MKPLILLFLALISLSFNSVVTAQTEWSWENPLPQGNWLQGVQMIDANNIICVGAVGTVVKSTSGGTQWTVAQFAAGTAAFFRGVSFAEGGVGTLVGWNGTIARTIDAGNTWSLQNSNTTNGHQV